MHTTLVPCEEAIHHLDHADWLFVDCRFELADPNKGVREYAKGHIPGAFYADLGRDLSGPVGDGHKGRHPLPMVGAFQRWAGQQGITPTTQVVCYDDVAGQWASRLWWLLRYYGHKNVAVLDGGLTRWKAMGLPLRTQHEKARKATTFLGQPGQMLTVTAEEIATGSVVLVDARAPERFRGEVEPIDKRAGHIPGARSVPFAGNVGPDMRFLSAEKLRERYAGIEGKVACYCGSGTTATLDVLALEVAGLPTPALYPGSWSEWSYPEAGRPIETGPVPPA
ncbi:MAG: sulfurtransferase [bacterium]